MGKAWVRHPPELRERVRQARRGGLSIKQIAAREGLSNSTVCLWVRDITLTGSQVAEIARRRRVQAGESNARRVGERHDQWRREARELWVRHSTEAYFLLEIGMYWGEGDKRSRRLVIANSDPGFIGAWITWCRTYTPNEHIRTEAAVHPDVVVGEAQSYWEHVVGPDVPVRVLPVKVWKRYDGEGVRLPFGVARVYISHGAEWHTKMVEWIQLAAVM